MWLLAGSSLCVGAERAGRSVARDTPGFVPLGVAEWPVVSACALLPASAGYAAHDFISLQRAYGGLNSVYGALPACVRNIRMMFA